MLKSNFDIKINKLYIEKLGLSMSEIVEKVALDVEKEMKKSILENFLTNVGT